MDSPSKDLATNSVEVVQASKFLAHGHAYRYKEELGTRVTVEVAAPQHSTPPTDVRSASGGLLTAS